jgi:DNA repair protein RadC
MEAANKEDKRERYPITKWPEGERPREKLISLGPENLSSSELLAILISTGTDKLSAVDVGKLLLQKFKTLENLANASLTELMEMDGIGPAKAITLQAAFQLARNRQKEIAEKKFVYFKQPLDVAEIFIPKIGHLQQEIFAVVLLDASGKYIHSEIITKGTLNTSLVHPREVFKVAIKYAAGSIILVHNHPSGDLIPSREDHEVTRQIIEAGKLIEIPVHDHLIIAANGYLSMKEEGYI